ncbi:MAG TPA: GNAT family N-acetyltransferase [Ktedonobacterales bacterium]|nr:GNAT family N-acetyltransferase [Ktedonobacterales bacterium]
MGDATDAINDDADASPVAHQFFPTLTPVSEELRGPRVILRRHRASDAPDLFAALQAARERLAPWLGFPDRLQSIEATRDWLLICEARWLERKMLGYAIRDGDTGVYLGGVDLHSIEWGRRFFALGYWLRDGAEGHGYMSEAVRLVTDYVFTELAAEKVALRCDARNMRSAAVAERLGFVREARLRNETRAKDGTLADELQYALIRDDPRWPTR